jgi:hypothetical protein
MASDRGTRHLDRRGNWSAHRNRQHAARLVGETGRGYIQAKPEPNLVRPNPLAGFAALHQKARNETRKRTLEASGVAII